MKLTSYAKEDATKADLSDVTQSKPEIITQKITQESEDSDDEET